MMTYDLEFLDFFLINKSYMRSESQHYEPCENMEEASCFVNMKLFTMIAMYILILGKFEHYLDHLIFPSHIKNCECSISCVH